MTRLAVTYEIMPEDELRQVVRLAHAKGVPVYVDDAGGARVGPAIFDQPRTLQLGGDVVATGLDNSAPLGHGLASWQARRRWCRASAPAPSRWAWRRGRSSIRRRCGRWWVDR